VVGTAAAVGSAAAVGTAAAAVGAAAVVGAELPLGAADWPHAAMISVSVSRMVSMGRFLKRSIYISSFGGVQSSNWHERAHRQLTIGVTSFLY
jgi:hypothetical protein